MTGTIIWVSLGCHRLFVHTELLVRVYLSQKNEGEKLSYIVVGVLELLIFVVTLTWRMGLCTLFLFIYRSTCRSIELKLLERLPLVLACSQPRTGTVLPWHNCVLVCKQDAQAMKQREANVRVRNSARRVDELSVQRDSIRKASTHRAFLMLVPLPVSLDTKCDTMGGDVCAAMGANHAKYYLRSCMLRC